MHKNVMKKHLFLAALIAFGPAAAKAEPVTESLTYNAYIGGLPLGTLDLKIAMDDARYATEARFDVATLLRWALDTNARATSSGSVSSGAPVPAKFQYWVRDGKKERNTEMLFDASGNPVEVKASPKFRQRSYDISTLDEVKQAVDPASAVALLSAPRTAACELDMTVFDGRKLHRITLEPSATKSDKFTRCTGRYERLAGFKAKYMAPDRRAYAFDAELTQIAPDRWRPQRVWAKTKFGNAVVVLR